MGTGELVSDDMRGGAISLAGVMSATLDNISCASDVGELGGCIQVIDSPAFVHAGGVMGVSLSLVVLFWNHRLCIARVLYMCLMRMCMRV